MRGAQITEKEKQSKRDEYRDIKDLETRDRLYSLLESIDRNLELLLFLDSIDVGEVGHD